MDDMYNCFFQSFRCHEEISNLVQRTAEKILAATESQSLENNIEDSMPHILDALARVGCCEPTDTEFVENLIARAITKVESLQGKIFRTERCYTYEGMNCLLSQMPVKSSLHTHTHRARERERERERELYYFDCPMLSIDQLIREIKI